MVTRSKTCSTENVSLFLLIFIFFLFSVVHSACCSSYRTLCAHYKSCEKLFHISGLHSSTFILYTICKNVCGSISSALYAKWHSIKKKNHLKVLRFLRNLNVIESSGDLFIFIIFFFRYRRCKSVARHLFRNISGSCEYRVCKIYRPHSSVLILKTESPKP